MFLYPINEEADPPAGAARARPGRLHLRRRRPPVLDGAARRELCDDRAPAGQLAAKWIREQLGGKAKVVYFNEDSSETLIPRHKTAIAEDQEGGAGRRGRLRHRGQVRHRGGVAGVRARSSRRTPTSTSSWGRRRSSPASTRSWSPRAAAKDPKIFVSSLAGSADDLKKIAAGDNVYKATFAYPFPVYGWGIGQFTADWQAGRSIRADDDAHRRHDRDLLARARQAVLGRHGRPARDLGGPGQARPLHPPLGNINWEQRNQYWRAEAQLPV